MDYGAWYSYDGLRSTCHRKHKMNIGSKPCLPVNVDGEVRAAFCGISFVSNCRVGSRQSRRYGLIFGHYPPLAADVATITQFWHRHAIFFFIFFHYLTYSRWTSSLPSCLWLLRTFPFLPGPRHLIFYRDTSPAILQLVNQWLKSTYSRSHAFRYGRKKTILLW